MLACANPPAERRSKPHPNQVLKCPRCESLDTKFCYYNNYSTTQPRYFCKNCKRYWTEGGALRNVPVGGGLRKNKRSKQRTSSMPLSSSPGQHVRSSPFAFEGLHLHPSHSDDLASSFSGSPTSGADIAAFRYLNGQSADPNGYESCIYKAGDQPSSQNQFNYNDVRHFPQFYTGYCYNSAMRDMNQNDFEGYSHPGSTGRSDHNLPSCAQGSGAMIDPDRGSYKGLRITSFPLSSGGLHGHKLHEQGEHRRGINGGNESDGMTMGYFYEHKRPRSEEVMLNEEDGDANQLQPSSNELMLLQDSTTRESTEGGGSQEGVSNAMNISYPYDWQQISEGLFGGTADYYYMQAGGSGVGGGSGGGSEAAAAVSTSANWAEFNVGAV